MPVRDPRSFREVLSAAIDDLVANGFDSMERVDRWTRDLRAAAERSLISAKSLEQQMADGLATIYRRMVERGGIFRYSPGAERFTLDRVKPALRAELDRRILASANLIKLNRGEAIEKTLRRFQGWSTSIPPGGVSAEKRSKVKDQVRKSLAQLPFEERRVLIDQGHKLTAALSETLARDGGAIAGRWRSNWRQPGYDYRTDHKDRDGEVYLVRDAWAKEQGLAKPGRAGYVDDVTAPGQDPFCRCYWIWLYNLRDLPDGMLTAKGRSALAGAQGREEVRAARTGRADAASGRSNAYNAGVVHLGRRGAGSDPACGGRAHVTYDKDRFRAFAPEEQCKRCATKLQKWDEIRAKTGRGDDSVFDDAGRLDAASEKLSQAAAVYAPVWSNPPTRCQRCAMFVRLSGGLGGNACTAVLGEISAHGHCRVFAPVDARAKSAA